MYLNINGLLIRAIAITVFIALLSRKMYPQSLLMMDTFF